MIVSSFTSRMQPCRRAFNASNNVPFLLEPFSASPPFCQQPISSGSGTIIVNSQSITTTPTSYVTTQSTPVASVAPVPALAAQQHITISASTGQSSATAMATGQPTVVSTQQQQNVVTTQQPQQPQQHGQQATQTVVVTTTTGGQTAQQRNSLDNTKEKCRKFLTNLIELSKREPKPVEKNVRTLIQELVDANVEPEEFCERLERLLNASPQPCLIGFLKVRSRSPPTKSRKANC